jgi:nucleoside-diphosphate-sugar epimerase
MIQHQNVEPKDPSRVVMLGASGFIGSSLKQKFESLGISTLSLTSKDMDLTDTQNVDRLAAMLKPTDAVIMLSAITPDKGRDLDAFMRNIKMGETVCKALQKSPVAHTIYMSSDAVYAGDLSHVSESTPAAPGDLYGVMHKTREVMFQSVVPKSLAILRLTITFGVSDTHNSYGPNRFRRSALKDKKITLFGEGEEMRDHIFVDDTVELILQVLRHQSHGLLNISTGKSYSFMDIAKKVAAMFDFPVDVVCTPRQNPVTHRHYDITNIYKAFPVMKWTSLDDSLARVHSEMLSAG